MKILLPAGLIVVVCLASTAFAQPQVSEVADRAITHLRGDVYGVREGRQHTVFMVTPAGIVLVDPLNASLAAWLKEQLASRFPSTPVRYVLLTHHHFDRAEGAGVFRDSAEIVGHRNFGSELRRARRSFPPFLANLDLDRSGALEHSEVVAAPADTIPGSRDHNADGVMTPEELYWRVTDTETSYDGRRSISLGGQTVELIHVPSQHAADMTVLHFATDRVAFAVDPPAINSSPFIFGAAKPQDVLAWTQSVSALAFDLLLTGDGETVTRNDLLDLRAYLQTLVELVAAGYEDGLTVPQIQRSVPRPVLTGSRHQPARPSHIADIFRSLRLFRAELAGMAMMQHNVANDAFCARYTTCETRTSVPAASASLTFSIGRVGAAVEVISGLQSTLSRTSRFYDEDVARRDSRASLLFRYAVSPARSRVAVLGGLSLMTTDMSGIHHIKEGLAPLSGRHFVENRQLKLGLTTGIDFAVPLTTRFSLVMPVRATYATGFPGEQSDVAYGRIDVHTGVGLAMRVLRRIR